MLNILHYLKRGKKPPTNRSENLERLGRAVKEGRTRVDVFPAVLYLETTSICNLRCPMCPATMDIPEYRYDVGRLDTGLIDKLEHMLPMVSRCFLSGGGEPLLHPELFTIIERVKAAGVEVFFNCNATLMDEERSRALVELGVDCISFSVDGSTAETYQAIRAPAKFEKVLDNIRTLSELKKSLGSERPYLNLQYTLLDDNMSEVRGIVPIARNLGIAHVVIEPLTPVFCFNEKYKAFYDKHVVEPDRICRELKDLAAEAEQSGMLLSSHYLEAQTGAGNNCIQPWMTFGVRVDGRIFTCCGTPHKMGHLGESTFEEIWNGPEYRRLREQAARSEFPEFCRLCLEENRCNQFNAELIAGN